MIENVQRIPMTPVLKGIWEEPDNLFVDLDTIFDWSLKTPEENEVLICPNCGRTILTIEEIRKQNLWYTDYSYTCDCGNHDILFLYSHD